MRSFSALVVALASAFFRWWFGALCACIPERVHQFVGARRPLVAAEFEGYELLLRRQDGGQWQEIGRLDMAAEDPLAMRREILELVAASGSRKNNIVTCVASDEVLRRKVELPLEANENLPEVLALELDRFTPLKRPDDICFDHHVLDVDRVGRRVVLEMVVALRREVEETQQRAQACGLDPRRVGVFAAFGAATNHFMNLANEHGTRNTSRAERRITSGLSGLAALLAAIAIYIPLQQKEQALAALESRIERSREEVAEVNRLRKEMIDTLTNTQLLAGRRQGTPPVIAVLDEVTRLLDDDTWLVEFRADGEHLVMSGYSTAASALVALLEDSEMLAEVRFDAPVTPDPSLGKERFSLTARLVTSASDAQQMAER